MSLRGRLLSAFAYVLVLVSLALVVPFALNLVRRIDAEVKAEATGQAQLIAASASGRLGDRAELERLTRRASRALSGRVIVVNARGRLLADSAGQGLRSTSYANRPEIRDALRGRPAQGERHSESLGEQLLFTAVPVVSAGRSSGAVRVTQSIEAVNDRKRRDVLVLVGLALAVLVLGLAVAWLLASSLSRPLRRLGVTAARIGRGETGARAPVEGSKEQRDVALAFNSMTDRLANALEAQKTFVSNASHQLRTPLTGLRLRFEAAARKTRDSEIRRELAAAERETERLADLLSDLLILAREERPPAGPVVEDLGEAMTAARGRWEAAAAQGGHELTWAGPSGVAVRASREDVAVMLDNLLENAFNYSPAGAPVSVEWSAEGDEGVLVVLDGGPGIPEDERDAVFERFYRGQLSRRVQGTGLGLPIVDSLARRWGGSVRLSDRPGGGTRAEVRLPLGDVGRLAPGAGEVEVTPA
jgi:two-component system, OmpR family, sensor kinase